MPYRRLPKTDTARLKALRTILDDDDVYTVDNRIIDWKTLNKVQPAYDHLYAANQQYISCLAKRMQKVSKVSKLKKNAELFLRHFVMVLYMSVERGEIKKSDLPLYGLTPEESILKNFKSADYLAHIGASIIAGEKKRIDKGGLPIYNPSIAKVAVHYDLFNDAYQDKAMYQKCADEALVGVVKSRVEADGVILDIWDMVEKSFEGLPPEQRYDECRKYGVVYYYRRKEPHVY